MPAARVGFDSNVWGSCSRGRDFRLPRVLVVQLAILTNGAIDSTFVGSTLHSRSSCMHILHVVGARPNLMKVAPVMGALKHYSEIKQSLIHTGQHYDTNMSEVFFQQLAIPAPDVNLGVGSGSHARQTAEIMTRFELIVLERKPDLVLVYGDVNSTVAAALVCSKLLIRVGHVEAGLRSLDRTMPEEINRLVTDQLADLLFSHCEDADTNLRRGGVSPGKVHNVGNVMIDSLIRFLPLTERHKVNGLPADFAMVTL